MGALVKNKTIADGAFKTGVAALKLVLYAPHNIETGLLSSRRRSGIKKLLASLQCLDLERDEQGNPIPCQQECQIPFTFTTANGFTHDENVLCTAYFVIVPLVSLPELDQEIGKSKLFLTYHDAISCKLPGFARNGGLPQDGYVDQRRLPAPPKKKPTLQQQEALRAINKRDREECQLLRGKETIAQIKERERQRKLKEERMKDYLAQFAPDWQI